MTKTLAGLTLACLLAIILVMSGCGANKEAMERQEMIDELAGTVWQGDYAGGTLSFTFEDDRVVILELTGVEPGTGTYTVNDSEVVISDSEEAKTFTRTSETTMRGRINDVEVVLTRQ